MQTVCSQFRLQKVFVLPKIAQLSLILRAKTFVLLSQHILIDIIHVSAHQGNIGNEFADLLANMARTCVASHSPSEWPHIRLELTLPVSDDLVVENFLDPC